MMKGFKDFIGWEKPNHPHPDPPASANKKNKTFYVKQIS